MFWFAYASLSPAALLLGACVAGGLWPWLGLAWMTVAVWLMDRLGRRPGTAAGDGLALSLGLAAAHSVLWIAGIVALGGAWLDLGEKLVLGLGLGLWFGQVSNSNAHELIHRRAWLPRLAGVLIYVSLLFGHHASAHLHVHHVHAATGDDPNTARRGEGYWRYLSRVWRQEFMSGLGAETARLRRATPPRPLWRHPYVLYVSGGTAALGLAALLGEATGVLALVVLSAHAQAQLYLSDYVQHYGLRRRARPDGRPEPTGPQHSWNAPHWYSSAMMLNAPRHSDHHLSPGRPFPQLDLTPDMPVLPRSLPVMATLALVPPLWRRVMDPRLDAVDGGSMPAG